MRNAVLTLIDEVQKLRLELAAKEYKSAAKQAAQRAELHRLDETLARLNDLRKRNEESTRQQTP